MVKLENWYLEEYDRKKGIAWGIVSGHDRLFDGAYIHTSRIEKLELHREEEELLMYTKSGNAYLLKWYAMDLEKKNSTRQILRQFGISDDFFLQCPALKAQSEKELLSVADRRLQNNELLLKTAKNRAFFKDKQGDVREIPILIHTGMFQDSVLVRDCEQGQVDFRYFPDGLLGTAITPYHWSNGLKAVLIENSSRYDISFIGTSRRILCRAGKVTRIESREYQGEGLFSPDIVDGKCFFDNKNEK